MISYASFSFHGMRHLRRINQDRCPTLSSASCPILSRARVTVRANYTKSMITRELVKEKEVREKTPVSKQPRVTCAQPFTCRGIFSLARAVRISRLSHRCVIHSTMRRGRRGTRQNESTGERKESARPGRPVHSQLINLQRGSRGTHVYT